MIDPLKKAKLLWQCRRGMLELDLILQRFAEQQLDHMTIKEVEAFDRLLGCTDPQLFSWLMAYTQPDDKELLDIVAFIKSKDQTR